jgi:ribose 1,5-bisphosphokinase PhnN
MDIVGPQSVGKAKIIAVTRVAVRKPTSPTLAMRHITEQIYPP